MWRGRKDGVEELLFTDDAQVLVQHEERESKERFGVDGFYSLIVIWQFIFLES